MNIDPLAVVERLGLRAKSEQGPTMAIENRVLATLHTYRFAPGSLEKDYLLFCAGAFVVACAASILFCAMIGDESLLSFTQSFVTVMQ